MSALTTAALKIVVEAALHDATAPGMGPTGRAEDGPYPATLEEVADVVLEYLKEIDYSGLLVTILHERLERELRVK